MHRVPVRYESKAMDPPVIVPRERIPGTGIMILTRKITRRALFGFGALASVAAIGSEFAFGDTTADLEFTYQKLPISNLPKSFANYRVGLVGDFHIGRSVPDEWAAHAVDTLVSQGIDMLLVAGDYIAINDSVLSRTLARPRNKRLANLPYEQHAEIVYPLVASLLSDRKVKDGVFAVFGNHDLWVAPDLCKESFDSAGIHLLVNQSISIERGTERLTVVGLDDYWNGYPRWPSATPPGISKGELRIVLAHNPDLLSALLEKTNYEFTVGMAGHTHGGQIALPATGALFYNIRDTRMGHGLFKHPKGSMTYTTRGIGVVEIPYRFNCRPEATILEFVAA